MFYLLGLYVTVGVVYFHLGLLAVASTFNLLSGANILDKKLPHLIHFKAGTANEH